MGRAETSKTSSKRVRNSPTSGARRGGILQRKKQNKKKKKKEQTVGLEGYIPLTKTYWQVLGTNRVAVGDKGNTGQMTNGQGDSLQRCVVLETVAQKLKKKNQTERDRL